MNPVATKKLLENEQVIVWELELAPGESTGVHRHTLDYLVHVIEGSTLLATDGQGNNPAEVTLEAHETHYFEVTGDIASAGSLQTSATHEAKNIGTTRYRELMVELKRPPA